MPRVREAVSSGRFLESASFIVHPRGLTGVMNNVADVVSFAPVVNVKRRRVVGKDAIVALPGDAAPAEAATETVPKKNEPAAPTAAAPATAAAAAVDLTAAPPGGGGLGPL